MINARNCMCMNAVDMRAFACMHGDHCVYVVPRIIQWANNQHSKQQLILKNSVFGREVLLCVQYLRSMQSLLSPCSNECNE